MKIVPPSCLMQLIPGHMYHYLHTGQPRIMSQELSIAWQEVMKRVWDLLILFEVQGLPLYFNALDALPPRWILCVLKENEMVFCRQSNFIAVFLSLFLVRELGRGIVHAWDLGRWKSAGPGQEQPQKLRRGAFRSVWAELPQDFLASGCGGWGQLKLEHRSSTPCTIIFLQACLFVCVHTGLYAYHAC